MVIYAEGVGGAGEASIITTDGRTAVVYTALILKTVVINPALRRKHTAVV